MGKATLKALRTAIGLPRTVGGAVSRMRPRAQAGMAVAFLRQAPRKRNSLVGSVGELWNFRGGWGHRCGGVTAEVAAEECMWVGKPWEA